MKLMNFILIECEKRISEVQEMARFFDLFNADVVLFDKLYKAPIAKVFSIIEKNIKLLVPDYVCTAHGQLGPSHLFIQADSDEFTLIDPKGFAKLYDPIIDICKIGKAMLFATEWLEENKYYINYHYSNKDNCFYIKDFLVDNYCANDMKKKYNELLDLFQMFKGDFKIRNIAMMCVDLISGLPFAYIAHGDERVAALMVEFVNASELLSEVFE